MKHLRSLVFQNYALFRSWYLQLKQRISTLTLKYLHTIRGQQINVVIEY